LQNGYWHGKIRGDTGMIDADFSDTSGTVNPNITRFISITDAVIANTTAETTLIGTGATGGSLIIPADSLVLGKKFLIKAQGIISDTSNPTFQTRMKLNSSIIADTGAASLMTGTNDHWVAEVEFVVRAEGSGTTGKIKPEGSFQTEAPVHVGMINTGELDIDTTIDQTIDVTGEWSAANAANTISCVIFEVHEISI